MSDNQSPELFGQTPSQTVGPFFHFGLSWPQAPQDGGERIEIVGMVLDGDCAPVPDAFLEFWQADASGRYSSDTGFSGFGRCATQADGSYRFVTIRPGRVPGTDGRSQAPHIAISVLGRGLLKRLATRLYFADDDGNDEDPVLNLVPAPRRGTLLAHSEGADRWLFDIRLQGERETVFFAL